MAEEILVRTSLNDQMLEAGTKLLQDIKDANFDIMAAFWLFFVEAGEWRLVLVSPRVDSDGPRKLYAELSERLYDGKEKVYGLDIMNITFMSLNDKIVGALAGANWSYKRSLGYGLSGQRLYDVHLNGTYIENMYLYFIDDSIKIPRGSSWQI